MGNTASVDVDAHRTTVICSSSATSPTLVADFQLDYAATARPGYPQKQKLSKPRVGKRLEAPYPESPAAGGGFFHQLRPRQQPDLQKARPPLPRRPVPPSGSVSGVSPADEGDAAVYPWPDINVGDCIPQAPPPLPPLPDLDQQHHQQHHQHQQQKKKGLLRSLSMRSERRSCAAGFMRGGSRSNSMTAATESFAGEGYVPQVIESTRYALSKRNSVSRVDGPWPTQERRPSQADTSPTESDGSNFQAAADVTPTSLSAGEAGWKTSNPGPQSDRVQITRANSDASLYVPVRRRSLLQTPGVATRTPRPAPPPAPPQSNPAIVVTSSARPLFRFSVPATPTDTGSRRTSVDSGINPASGSNIRIGSTPQLPTTWSLFGSGDEDGGEIVRVVTPCEENYRQLGGIKFGSLRIVNGSPMASPGIERGLDLWGQPVAEPSQRSAGTAIRENGQLAAGLGRGSAGGGFAGAGPEVIAPTIRRMARPLSPVAGSIAGETPTESPFLETEFSVGADEDMLDWQRQLQQQRRQMHRLASPALSPTFQITSKISALEAQLFDDDAASGHLPSPEFSPREVLSVREDPNAKPQRRPRPDPSQRISRTMARSDSGVATSPAAVQEMAMSLPAGAGTAALAKADSGYSSNVSLRSLDGGGGGSAGKRARSRSNSRPPVPEKEIRLSTTAAADCAALQPMEDISPVDLANEFSAPPLPPKDGGGACHGPRSPSLRKLRIISSPTYGGSRPHIGSTDSLRSTDSAAPLPPLPPPPPAEKMSTSMLSIGSGSHRPGKLKRLFSSGTGLRMMASSGPPTVHAIHTITRGVPSVPHEVEAKLHERTGLFPIITNRLALRVEPSKETLRTIFSVGSLEAASVYDVATEASLTAEGEELPHGMASAVSSMAQPRIARKPVPPRAAAQADSEPPQQSQSQQQQHQQLQRAWQEIMLPAATPAPIPVSPAEIPACPEPVADPDIRHEQDQLELYLTMLEQAQAHSAPLPVSPVPNSPVAGSVTTSDYDDSSIFDAYSPASPPLAPASDLGRSEPWYQNSPTESTPSPPPATAAASSAANIEHGGLGPNRQSQSPPPARALSAYGQEGNRGLIPEPAYYPRREGREGFAWYPPYATARVPPPPPSTTNPRRESASDYSQGGPRWESASDYYSQGGPRRESTSDYYSQGGPRRETASEYGGGPRRTSAGSAPDNGGAPIRESASDYSGPGQWRASRPAAAPDFMPNLYLNPADPHNRRTMSLTSSVVDAMPEEPDRDAWTPNRDRSQTLSDYDPTPRRHAPPPHFLGDPYRPHLQYGGPRPPLPPQQQQQQQQQHRSWQGPGQGTGPGPATNLYSWGGHMPRKTFVPRMPPPPPTPPLSQGPQQLPMPLPLPSSSTMAVPSRDQLMADLYGSSSDQGGGRYPTLPPKNHRTGQSVGPADMGQQQQQVQQQQQQPPFRVLHSYNSPAYRNVPIWG